MSGIRRGVAALARVWGARVLANVATLKKENPASGEKPGSWGGIRLGDRAEAEHREGGREILRNRREEGEERRDLVVSCHRG